MVANRDSRHTHQLSPRRYRTYSRHMTNGRFVHHDDNLDDSTLSEASHNAEKLYFSKYGVPYKNLKLCRACPAPPAQQDIFCIVCIAPPRDGQPGAKAAGGCFADVKPEAEAAGGCFGAAVKPEDPSCSSACRSGSCSTACRSGCGNYCRGGLCRDQCRAACGYVCGACETKQVASEMD